MHAQLSPLEATAALDADVVITVTTSTLPVYDELAVPGRLVIGVGAFTPSMAELGTTVLAGSHVYVDDPAGARDEAGDLIQAKVDWVTVRPLSTALRDGADRSKPIAFKSVGTAAWDLAAARVARHRLASRA